ncbi:MAG: hypothetical protein L6Q99_12240 [Planctomycetes bacterium]|nr:hypothetical protein [Planctomycetota bacterium]
MPPIAELDTVSSVTRWPLRGQVLTFAFVGVLGTNTVARDHNENKLADQLTEDSKTSQLPPTRFVAFTEHTLTAQHRKNLALAALVQSWLDDEDSNDAEVGPELDRILRENPLRLRE